jgi:hypothetical protein
MIMNDYMDAYVDRRMTSIIEEWQLARRDVIGNLERRVGTLEGEIVRIRTVEKIASDRLASLEARAEALRGRTR